MKQKRSWQALSAITILALIGGLMVLMLPINPAQALCYSDVWVAPPPLGNDGNPGTMAQPFATIGFGANAVCPNGTVHVMAGTYTEQVNLTASKSLKILGAGRDLVTWNVQTGSACCIKGDMSLYTGTMAYEIAGFTFNCRPIGCYTHGVGIQVNRASSGPLDLDIHDNRFIEDRASGDSTHWGTSMLLCHNRFAARNAVAPVRIYNNIDLTWGGMTMSNTQAYDIYRNTFDGCSDAIYNGHGCPDTAGETFGDHHIYENIFRNASDSLHPGGMTPAIDWQYYGTGGATHLPSIIEYNIFDSNDTAIRFQMDTNMVYPNHLIRYNDFTGNGTALLAQGTYPSTVNAENNWWGDNSGPSGAGTGSGDAVSTNVDFTPWLIRSSTASTPGGAVGFASSGGGITGLTAVPDSTLPAAGKPAVAFPYGLFSFTIVGVVPGSSVTVTLTFPNNLPPTTQYWAFQNGAWLDCAPILGDNDGDNELTLLLKDGGFKDADGVANGTIVDPSGPCLQSVSVNKRYEDASTGSLPVRHTPPNLRPTNLSVSQARVRVNQPVTITAEVVNDGELEGNTNIALIINGFTEQVQALKLGPGAAKTVTFTVEKAEPGKYDISVGSQRASFIVLSEAKEGTATAQGGIMPLVLMGGLFIVVIAILLVAFRRKSTY